MTLALVLVCLILPVRSPAASTVKLDPIEHTAVIDAVPSEVWRAWTTAKGVTSWMVPQADIDLRVGGVLRTRYDREGKLGDPGTIENLILSYDPERMISIKAVRTPESFPFKTAIKSMWTVIYMEPAGDGKSRVTVRSLGFTADTESQQMRAFFDRGNKITLDTLAARYAKK
jgi:uncharacterized protein YndB with AHSA1/START domain